MRKRQDISRDRKGSGRNIYDAFVTEGRDSTSRAFAVDSGKASTTVEEKENADDEEGEEKGASNCARQNGGRVLGMGGARVGLVGRV